MNITASLL